MSVKPNGYDILRFTIYVYCGTLLGTWSLSERSLNTFLTTYLFHDIGVMLRLRSLEGDLAGVFKVHLLSVTSHALRAVSRQPCKLSP